MRSRTRATARRGAFTLVELLVVISIALVLSALALLIVPQAVDFQRASDGGARLQNWLMAAQSRAGLDRAPRGVRLMLDANNPQPGYYTQAQFVERPDDITSVATNSTVSSGASLNQLTFSTPDVVLGSGDTGDLTTWSVQAGDYIEVLGGGLMHQIQAVNSTTTVTLSSPLPQSVSGASFRIERAPRVVGDEPETMPTNIVVDANQNQNANYTAGGGTTNPPFASSAPNLPQGTSALQWPADVLFSPKGEVLNAQSSLPLVFWVRDVTEDPNGSPFERGPTLIVVYPRSGRIAAVEVNPDSTFASPTGNGLSYPFAFIP